MLEVFLAGLIRRSSVTTNKSAKFRVREMHTISVPSLKIWHYYTDRYTTVFTQLLGLILANHHFAGTATLVTL
jgi:hypothetical protein